MPDLSSDWRNADDGERNATRISFLSLTRLSHDSNILSRNFTDGRGSQRYFPDERLEVVDL